MQNITNLQRRGVLTEQQLLHAYKFAKNPNSYTMAPTFYRVLHDAIIKDEPLEEMEKRRGWPARSAKAMVGLILHAMQEMGGTHSDEMDDGTTAQERLAYVTADNPADYMEPMRKHGFTSREARIFLVLKRAKGRMCSRDMIMARMYADRIDEAPEAGIVEVFVCNMRKKLQGSDWRIDTLRGEGYTLSDATTPQPSSFKYGNLTRDVDWFNRHVNNGTSLRAIAKEHDVQPSTVMRAVARLLHKYNDDQLEDEVKKLRVAS